MRDEYENKRVGRRIQELRIQRGLTVRELAEVAGFSNHSTISRIENGQIDPRLSTLHRIATGLGTDIKELL